MNNKIYIVKLYNPDEFEYNQLVGYFSSEQNAQNAVKNFYESIEMTFTNEDYEISESVIDKNYLLLSQGG